MAVRDKNLLWTFMLMLAGAVGQRVNYPHPVCAVKGSTVTLPCTFTPLQSVGEGRGKVPIEIVRVRWCQNHLLCHRTTTSVYDSNSTTNDPRYKYLGDKKGNCTLQITDIREEDNATFRFRMEANDERGHWTEQSGVKVSVIETVLPSVNTLLVVRVILVTLLTLFVTVASIIIRRTCLKDSSGNKEVMQPPDFTEQL